MKNFISAVVLLCLLPFLIIGLLTGFIELSELISPNQQGTQIAITIILLAIVMLPAIALTRRKWLQHGQSFAAMVAAYLDWLTLLALTVSPIALWVWQQPDYKDLNEFCLWVLSASILIFMLNRLIALWKDAEYRELYGKVSSKDTKEGKTGRGLLRFYVAWIVLSAGLLFYLGHPALWFVVFSGVVLAFYALWRIYRMKRPRH